MSSVFEFVAQGREGSGTGGARGIRRQGDVPAVLYGGSKEPKSLLLNHNEVIKHLEHEAVYSHVLDLKVDGKVEKAILKAIQRHPAKPRILHMDFMRISAKEKFRIHVPLHFLNEEKSVGAKKGGVTMHNMVDVEVSCLPAALPEYIELDLSALDIGESLHLTDIKVPAGIELVALLQQEVHDQAVVTITAAKVASEEDEEGPADAEDAEDAESTASDD
jgi:large subunit ribosomal protein L25